MGVFRTKGVACFDGVCDGVCEFADVILGVIYPDYKIEIIRIKEWTCGVWREWELEKGCGGMVRLFLSFVCFIGSFCIKRRRAKVILYVYL